MNILTLINPMIASIFAGLMIGAGILVLLSKYLIGFIRDKTHNQPAIVASQPVPIERPSLTGLSWIIAVTHRSVSQFTGLIMSFATLIAIILSIICAVVGIAIISYQQYGSIVLSAVGAAATFILALLIENTSINALKTIRLANEEIAQAEQAHYAQIVKQMEESFSEDVCEFAKVDSTTLTKEEVQSMQRAARLKLQARKQFEKKRKSLMREQTRTARHNRKASIPFAVIGILFSATAGGLFWHTVLSSLPLWLNITVGTMFAAAVSVTFVQSELLKRIKDDAIAEALRSGEMQNVMLKQQSEEMVLEMVVDTMAAVKHDPNTLIEMGTGIKEELKTTIRTLTQQTTARLVTVEEVKDDIKLLPSPKEEEPTRKPRKEPEWLSHPALLMVEKMHPKMHLKLASWKATGRVSISIETTIETLIETTGQSRKTIQRRIKDGTLRPTPHNSKRIFISSILEWLQIVDAPLQVQEDAHPEKTEEPLPETNNIPAINASQEQNTTPKDETETTEQTHATHSTLLHAQEPDRLSIALSALRINPALTDEELAPLLGVRQLASARLWRVKAQMMLESVRDQKPNGLSSGKQNLNEYIEIIGGM